MAKADSEPQGVGIFLSMKSPPLVKTHQVHTSMRVRSDA
jgi:hypothetical protein